MNPYRFARMEWWRRKSGMPQDVAVGFCENGDTYLTFDIREEKDGKVPVFSPICKVGSKEGHKQEAYLFYREQFEMDSYGIKAVMSCNYKSINDLSKTYIFEI
jgi:hypothetical protein